MHSINLLALTEKVDERWMPLYERSLSAREKEQRIRPEEIETIDLFVRQLPEGCVDELNHWFYSYTIPRISKEFDLLRIGSNFIVNLELKSQKISDEEIYAQLEKNRRYLGPVGSKIYSYTLVKTGDFVTLYQYTKSGLRKASIAKLAQQLGQMKNCLEEGIEKLFSPRNYLVSPFNDCARYVSGRYFLTDQQGGFQRKILKGIHEGKRIWSIAGGPGTGKSLLLYDLAKKLSEEGNVCVIHAAQLSEGHRYLNERMKFSVISAEDLRENMLRGVDVICVDEAQRMREREFELIVRAARRHSLKACIFSYDFEQVLSLEERARNIPLRIALLDGCQKELRLTKNIRSNEAIMRFVECMMGRRSRKYSTDDFSCIDVVSASGEESAARIVQCFEAAGYVFLQDSVTAIGQEYDRVVVMLDENFTLGEATDAMYEEDAPSADYELRKLLYQNVTRARERLCFVIRDNQDILEKLLAIKEHAYGHR
ncbi:MAG: DUF2075 domain-containing protein [Lachnospiraceae bacterium]|nr:DUF2075 domain-containing protein [Lachnospiraceae bacterium]